MAEITDPNGVRWSVYRRWGYRYWNAMDRTTGEWGAIVINLIQFAVMTPLWVVAKCLGRPWTIVIERNGTEVREVKVSGWRASQRRIQQFADAAIAGTLDGEIVERLPSETDPPPQMNVTPETWAKLPLESKVTLWRMYNSGELHRRS